MVEGNIEKKDEVFLSFNAPCCGDPRRLFSKAPGDRDGVPRLAFFLLVGDDGVAQDCDKASMVVAVAAEGEDCMFS